MNIVKIQGENEKRYGIYYEFDKDSRPLGEGGMGRIYKGFRVDMRSGIRSQVAIKAVHEGIQSSELLERARREASIMIDNENLMKMYGFIKNPEMLPNRGWVTRYYMPMELLVGVNLDDIIRGITTDQNGMNIPFAEDLHKLYHTNRVQAICIIAKALLAGIMALHNKGYIHRDIDPSNIMITIDGKIKLIDFGICKQISTLTTTDKSLTSTGTFIGKVNYAAPELVLGDVRNQNSTTDIYAIGMLLYQLYTGVLPFNGSDADVLAAHLNQKIPISNITHPGLRKVIAKATDKKQEKRYQSAAEMIVDLERMPILIKGKEPKFPKPFINWKLLGVIVAGISIIVAAVYLFKDKEKEYTPTVEELYRRAEGLLAYDLPDSTEKGYDAIRSIAKDSLFAPAVMLNYEIALKTKDSLRWNEAFGLVDRLASKDSIPEAIFECAICRSHISPKLDLPEVERYSIVNIEEDLLMANKLFEAVLIDNPNNYKASFWSLINYIFLKDPQTYGEQMKELYEQYLSAIIVYNDETAQKYKAASEKVIEVTLRNWKLI